MTSPTPPRATYRLQFSASFRFDDACRIVPYLAALGVSHIYASPLLAARPGSTHGYDIVDHNRLNEEIGDEAGLDRLVDALREHDMGLVVDFVPNHMGIGPDNPWWMDVLEWGRASPFADYFDIEWRPIEPTLAGKVLLPVLGDHYGAVLERGELKLRLDAAAGTFAVTYFDTPFPLGPGSYAMPLRAAAERGSAASAPLHALAREFGDAAKGRLDGAQARARRDRIARLKKRLAALLAENGAAIAAVRDVVEDLNGSVGRPGSFDALHALLESQAWRLAFWRVAAHEMNYRRFFDINNLAALRMEKTSLFDESHALTSRLLADGRVQGLRLDHVDGLRDPARYFERLQSLAGPGWRSSRWHRKPSRDRRRKLPLYLVIEKILAPHERLRRDWAVSGTSGYEFMSAVNGLFVDPAAKRFLERSYGRFTGRPLDFEAIRVDTKHLIMRDTLASELNVLANLFNRLAKQSRDTRDYSLIALRQALAGVAAHFPVYRTYVSERQTCADDRRDIDWAVARARRAAPGPDSGVYTFVHEVLTLDLLARTPRRHRRRDVIDASSRFQQFTGPVTAKAIEDTAFYRYACLLSLNEVGGDPARAETSPAAFHELNRRRLDEFPDSMLATATHDHKRGEDTRARLDVLSEVPATWLRKVRRWSAFNERKRHTVDDQPAPDRNDEYLLYQTIVGTWPMSLRSPFDGIESFRDRLLDYMKKAVREAKLQSSWASPNEAYEGALSRFVTDLLDPKLSRPFLEDVATFVDTVAPAGAMNGLAQSVLKLTSPGVPDLYQGTELWDLSLVDPDNRRPVDFEAREHALRDRHTDPAALLGAWRDGRIKQTVIRRILALRGERPELFADGAYRALEPTGVHAQRAIAFARITRAGDCIVVVVPRLARALLEPGSLLPRGWGDTSIAIPGDVAEHSFVSILTGEALRPEAGTLPVADVLRDLPVAVLRSTR